MALALCRRPVSCSLPIALAPPAKAIFTGHAVPTGTSSCTIGEAVDEPDEPSVSPSCAEQLGSREKTGFLRTAVLAAVELQKGTYLFLTRRSFAPSGPDLSTSRHWRGGREALSCAANVSSSTHPWLELILMLLLRRVRMDVDVMMLVMMKMLMLVILLGRARVLCQRPLESPQRLDCGLVDRRSSPGVHTWGPIKSRVRGTSQPSGRQDETAAARQRALETKDSKVRVCGPCGAPIRHCDSALGL